MFRLFIYLIFLQICQAQLQEWFRTECYIRTVNDKVIKVPSVVEAMMDIVSNTLNHVSSSFNDDGQDVSSNELICQNVSTIDFVVGKTYSIESAKNKLVIDLSETIRLQRNPIIAFVNHGGPNQLWTARHSQYGQAFNILTEVDKNKLLKEAMTYDPYNNMTLLRHLSDGVSQQWYIGKQCGEYVQIRSTVLHSGSDCLSQMGNGRPLALQSCNEIDRKQLWRLNII